MVQARREATGLLADLNPRILALYGRPGAERALIAAQDGAGLDVSLYLLLIARAEAGLGGWAGAGGLDRVLACSAHWQGAVVGPIRQARRCAKGLDPALYQRLKAVEVDAEFAAMAAYLSAGGAGRGQASGDAAAYLDRLDGLKSRDRQALQAAVPPPGPASG